MALAVIPRHNVTREDIGLIHVLNYGSALTDTTIQAALTAIGAEERILLLTPGTWTIANPRTIPANVRLMPAAGAVISINTGIILTINGPIDAPPRQLFSGLGSVALGRLAAHPAYVEWFGATGDGATDDTTAMNKTQNAVGTGGLIELIAPEYRVTQWEITKSDLTIEGRGFPAATGAVRIIGTSASLPVIHVNSVDRVALQRIFVNHSVTSDSGVHAVQLTDTTNITLKDVQVWADFNATPTTGSYGGLLIEAVAGETYDTHLVRFKAYNTRGNGLTLQGSASNQRVGETYCNECLFATNAGAGGDLAGIYVGDFVYGVYLTNRTTVAFSLRHSLLIWPTVADGRTLDIMLNDAVLDAPQYSNIKARNTSSINVYTSWIAAPLTDGWGIEQITSNVSILQVIGNRFGENHDGAIYQAGQLGLIVGNVFNGHSQTSQLAVYFSATSRWNSIQGNHFYFNANDIGDDGTENIIGPNSHVNRPRASMVGVDLGDNFSLFQNPTNPILLLDANDDYVMYNRAGNALEVFVAGTARGITSAAGITARRFYGNLLATAWTSARFTLSAGWGSTASVGTIVATDSRGYFTVTSAGTGQGANPTVTITFVDGAWENIPAVLVNQQTGSHFLDVAVTSVSTTGFVVTIVGTPVNGATFNFAFIVMG